MARTKTNITRKSPVSGRASSSYRVWLECPAPSGYQFDCTTPSEVDSWGEAAAQVYLDWSRSGRRASCLLRPEDDSAASPDVSGPTAGNS